MSFEDLTDWLPSWLSGPGLAVTVVLPLLGAVAAVGFLRLLAGKDLGPRIAGAGAAAGFILAYAAVVESRGVPLPFADHKPLAVALFGLLVGVVLDAEGWADRFGARWRRAAIVTIGIGVIAWLVTPLAMRTDPGPERNLIVAYVAGALLVFVRTTRIEGSAGTVPMQLAVASLGVAALAWVAGSGDEMFLALALAAAVFGFVVWNYPNVRFTPGAALVLGTAAPLLALAGALLLGGDGSPAGLGVLLLVFFSEWIAGHIRLGGGRLTRPIVLAVAGLLVVVAALVVARWTAGLGLPFLR